VELLDRLAVDVVLDVGANEGQWALGLRRAGFRGRLVSFEPIGASFERLRATSAGDPAWDVRQVALGREDGSVVLRRTKNTLLASALPLSARARACFPEDTIVEGEERAPLRRLDSILPELTPDLVAPRLFLKVDTQGLDLDVFEGARGILDQIVGLESELSVLPLYEGAPAWLEALAVYAAGGFSPTGFFPVIRNPSSLVLSELDCVMARHARLRARARPLEAPAVSVIVTACDDSPALRRCLETVAKQARPLSGEVVLAVNAAQDVLAADVRRALEAACDRIVFEPRVGKSHALNAAVRASRGEVIAFTDDDAEPQEGWLRALVEPLLDPDRDPALVGCGGPVEPVFAPDAPEWLRTLVSSKATHFLGPRHDLGSDPVDYVFDSEAETGAPLGASCAYRREVFDAYFFDPRLGPNRATGLRGGEDFLLARRLLRDGYRLRHLPEARVRHPVEPSRTTEAYVLRGYYLQGIERVRIERALGVELETLSELRAMRRHLQGKLLWKLLRGRRDPVWRLRLRTKLENYRGLIEETLRGASRSTP
jgi:FkbM family methyltransferase